MCCFSATATCVDVTVPSCRRENKESGEFLEQKNRSFPDAPASSPAVPVWESITGCLSFDRLPDRPEPDPSSTKAFGGLLGVFFLIRLIYIRLLPIVPQEAYYWSSRYPCARCEVANLNSEKIQEVEIWEQLQML
jgi:hypothetical protein